MIAIRVQGAAVSSPPTRAIFGDWVSAAKAFSSTVSGFPAVYFPLDGGLETAVSWTSALLLRYFAGFAIPF
jgi:hypothetical protein